MIYRARPEEIEQRRRAFIRKWRLRHRAVADSLAEAGDKLFASTRLPASQRKRARTTNAIECMHEDFKRTIKTQTILSSADTVLGAPRLGTDLDEKVDGWQSLAKLITDQPIALAA